MRELLHVQQVVFVGWREEVVTSTSVVQSSNINKNSLVGRV